MDRFAGKSIARLSELQFVLRSSLSREHEQQPDVPIPPGPQRPAADPFPERDLKRTKAPDCTRSPREDIAAFTEWTSAT
jgi:hypothetical protein